jgi:hypothetical protein
MLSKSWHLNRDPSDIFIISSEKSAERKAADVKDRDEGIAPAIFEEQSLTDELCSRPIPDEIMKVADPSKKVEFRDDAGQVREES